MSSTLDAVRGVMSTTVPRWTRLIEAVPSELLARRPQDGEWSALECLEHMLVVDRLVIGLRLQHLLEGRPELIPYDPDAPREPEPERTPSQLLAAYAAQRREHEAAVARLTLDDLQRRSHHPEFGAVTLDMLLNLWAAHDLQHTVQAEEALMQVFIPGTGVWRYEFADHDVERRTDQA